MIYLVDRHHAYTVTAYLASRGANLPITVLSYQKLMRTRRLPAAPCVFSDLDRLGPAGRAWAAGIRDQLDAGGVRVLNHPLRTLTREPLLRRLAEEGHNDFRVFRPDDPLEDVRYPVFVREVGAHTGSLTTLLSDRGELDQALRRLASAAGGHRRRDLLIVEFCDTSGADGLYRRYSAFRVGDAIVPRYLTFHEHWVVKAGGRRVTPATADAENEYVLTNPHAAWLREIFDLAGVEYGRMDYGMRGERPQVWEINLNPTIGPTRGLVRLMGRSMTDAQRALLASGRTAFDAGFRAAVETLEDAATSAMIEITPDPDLDAKARAEWTREAPGTLYRELRNAVHSWRERRRLRRET